MITFGHHCAVITANDLNVGLDFFILGRSVVTSIDQSKGAPRTLNHQWPLLLHIPFITHDHEVHQDPFVVCDLQPTLDGLHIAGWLASNKGTPVALLANGFTRLDRCGTPKSTLTLAEVDTGWFYYAA